ncbi:hypothetical protein OG21DRAFT_1196134 [Imleria badia]|nr:hypothetical protein OG21DRAFT_1196134 [Imleria badia]
MLPTPRKSQFPRLVQYAVVVDGSSSNEVKTANHLPGGSATQMEQPKTIGCAAIATSRFPSPSESPLSTLGKLRRVARIIFPRDTRWCITSDVNGDDLLAHIPALNCSTDDPSFLVITPISTKTRRRCRDDKYESIYVPPKKRNVDVKPLRGTTQNCACHYGHRHHVGCLLSTDAEMAECKKLYLLSPAVARSSVRVTVFQDMPAASTSSGGSSITRPNYTKTQETTVKNLEITK